mgnify:CR=1 FL=1
MESNHWIKHSPVHRDSEAKSFLGSEAASAIVMILIFFRCMDWLRPLAIVLIAVSVTLVPISSVAAEPSFGEIAGAVVRVDVKIKPGARTARSLGTERGGSGVVIGDDGLIVTIGYLIMESATLKVTAHTGKAALADFVAYDHRTGFGLLRAREDLGIKPFGIRAMNSLRVEKSYKLVGTELSIEYSPYESGLDRFIHPNKGKFIGLEALNKWREKGFNNKLVTLEVHNVTDADVLGNNPIYDKDKVVGRATGGDFGFRLNKSIALGMVKPEVATTGQKLKIDILGKMYDATILDESPYDPNNDLLRA